MTLLSAEAQTKQLRAEIARLTAENERLRTASDRLLSDVGSYHPHNKLFNPKSPE